MLSLKFHLLIRKDLPDNIQVGGRISPQIVWDYLEKIRATGTKVSFYSLNQNSVMKYNQSELHIFFNQDPLKSRHLMVVTYYMSPHFVLDNNNKNSSQMEKIILISWKHSYCNFFFPQSGLNSRYFLTRSNNGLYELGSVCNTTPDFEWWMMYYRAAPL